MDELCLGTTKNGDELLCVCVSVTTHHTSTTHCLLHTHTHIITNKQDYFLVLRQVSTAFTESKYMFTKVSSAIALANESMPSAFIISPSRAGRQSTKKCWGWRIKWTAMFYRCVFSEDQ